MNRTSKPTLKLILGDQLNCQHSWFAQARDDVVFVMMDAVTTKPAPALRLSPQKLRLSKWTAVAPRNKEKHFMVVELVEPVREGGAVDEIVLEAVYSRRRQTMAWRELADAGKWRRGWN